MERDSNRGDIPSQGEETIREGDLIIEERMNRREGLVEYEGTVEATGTTAEDDTVMDDAMQAGAAVLGGTGSTAMVDDAASMAGGGATGDVTPRSVDPLSMTTDNTPAGAAYADTVEGGPIAQVREGMRVVDAAGDEIGKVDFVKMGDPSAMTAVGEEPAGDGGLLGDGGGLFGGDDEPDVPDPFRHELIRVGFIKIDLSGFFAGHRYASADQIASVSGDTVMLSVTKDDLPKS